MTTPTRVKLPTLYGAQHRAFFHRHRYGMTEACTKAGKTLGALVWQANAVLTSKPERPSLHTWTAPVYVQAGIGYSRAANMFRGLAKPNDSKLRLTFNNGATWQFQSGEKPDNLYGDDVMSAVLEEVTRMRPEVFPAVRSTITATEAPLRAIGNVRGRGYWWNMARRAEQGEPGWHYSRITADDAIAGGVISRAEVADAEANLPHDVFRELYYCEASDDGGNPFGLQHIEACLIDGPGGGETACYGIDLARTVDWCAVIGNNSVGQMREEHRWRRESWDSTHRRIVAIVGDRPALADSTGLGDVVVEGLSRAAPNITGFNFAGRGKQQLMEGLAVSIQQGRVRVIRDSVTHAELKTFEYVVNPRTRHVGYSAPTGMHDDTVCALALADHCRFGGGLVTAAAVGADSEDDGKLPDWAELREDAEWGWT